DVIDSIRANERELRERLEARIGHAGVSWDWRKLDGNVIQSIIDQSRLMDIVVLSRPLDSNAQRPPLPIAGDIAINARAPVLAIGAGTPGDFDPAGCAMVAWNGSAEAAHALQLSLSLLRGASAVHLVEVSEEKRGLPSTEAAQYLSRHGIAAEIHDWPAKGRKIDVALLHAATELDAAFMVLGAYGHSRLRETIFGGVTRELIRSSHVPLVFAH
ncbi:MAG: universal stress protein, partial [Polymorphobacter sp.]